MIEPGLLSHAGELAASFLPPCKLCVVTDETVGRLYGGPQSALFKSLASAGFDVYQYTFPAGEKHKTLETVGAILDYLSEQRFHRGDALVALGGGVPGDMTGFAAAIYMRGIKFIQIPTTLLACVDSSIGGKTGVDLAAGKNLAGAFWHPELVLVDTDTFDTLTDDLYRDGLAEIIKASMIGDATILEDVVREGFQADLSADRTDKSDLINVIVKALRVKAAIVAADERETGIRQLLNLGHTIGHAIERCSGYAIAHGRAVAIGTVMACAAAERKGWTDSNCADLLRDLFLQFGYSLDPRAGAAELAAAALHDKKARTDSITIVYPKQPGECGLRPLPVSELEGFIQYGLDYLGQ